MKIFKKLIFFLKRPPVILIIGKDRACVKKFILQILKSEVLIFELDFSEVKNFGFFLKNSKLPILVINNLAEFPLDEAKGLAKALPVCGLLILNFDDETTRQIKNEAAARFLTYGFWEGAEVKATDINVSGEGTNLKINYQGSIVPFWFKNISDKEEIYSVLAAICVGLVLDINLVEMSQTLKSREK